MLQELGLHIPPKSCNSEKYMQSKHQNEIDMEPDGLIFLYQAMEYNGLQYNTMQKR